MTLPKTDINFRQQGVLRIEIAAIVMLLLALAIVLVTHTLPVHKPGVAQAGERLQVVPAVNAGTSVPLLLPVAGKEPNPL